MAKPGIQRVISKTNLPERNELKSQLRVNAITLTAWSQSSSRVGC